MNPSRVLLMSTVLFALGLNPVLASDVRTKVTNRLMVDPWWASQGGRFHAAADPSRPAILLVHGLNQSAKCWSKPSSMMSGFPGDATLHYFYDFRNPPKAVKKDRVDYPGVGIFKIDRSDKIDIDQNNWFDFLVQRGFTVASFSQPCCTIAQGYPAVREALQKLAEQTAPGSPPIALIGHSRGGLMIRKALKELGNLDGRVKWVITLHSPHQGSEMGQGAAQLGAEVVDLVDAVVPASIGNIPLTHDLKEEIKKLAVEVLRPVNKWVLNLSDRELMPDSPAIRDLRNNESALPGVEYYTFGGTNPTFVRFYAFVFDANSIVPHTSMNDLLYYNWTAKPVEIPLVSPMFDVVRNFTPEMAPGKGDSLVTYERARLPFSKHEKTELNHAEVLWNRPLQQKVASILATPLKSIKPRIK